MRRIIDQLNVSITTNRTCTLRCDHCYIEPELFSDKAQMTSEVFRSVFDRVDDLYELDEQLKEVEWEVIGGETTMMPFDWWSKELPWALDRIAQFNQKLRNPGSLNFLTNLIYKDKRYTGLLNEYANHPAFCLYTSWEPDTNRFGKRNQLFEMFYNNLCSIAAPRKTLDIILTRKIIEIGPRQILDMFVDAGITDFSMKMISPYGSGEAFFEPNMPTFQEMTDFFIEFDSLKPEWVTFTPQEEMVSSLYRGNSYQCNGNFKYDLSIEPDGQCHFNANQTGSQSALGIGPIAIGDPLWARKVCFENTKEQNKKLSLSHASCDQCEFLTHCNAGWYHYKTHDKDVIARYAETECPGFKQFWEHNKQKIRSLVVPRSELNHMLFFRGDKSSSAEASSIARSEVSESMLDGDYENYLREVSGANSVLLDRPTLFGHSMLERLWFYRDTKVTVSIDELALVQTGEMDKIIEHYLYGNLPNLGFSSDFIQSYSRRYQTPIARRLQIAKRLVAGEELAEPLEDTDEPFYVDDRNDELFRFVFGLFDALSLTPCPKNAYLQKLQECIEIEKTVLSAN